MREERGENIVGTCEGERRENEIFYNLIMHRKSTVFPNALRNTVRCHLMLLNLGLLMWVLFCSFFEIFPKHREENEL